MNRLVLLCMKIATKTIYLDRWNWANKRMRLAEISLLRQCRLARGGGWQNGVLCDSRGDAPRDSTLS